MKTICIMLMSIVLFSCQNQGKLDVQKAKQASIDSMKVAIEKQKVIDSMKVEMAQIEKRKVVVVNHTTGTNTQTAKRKKWSGAAKGAVIGAGVGAITGAIVDKKKGEGAIIGGLAGAGVGAGTGAIIDDSKKKP